ncbi:UDP-N-acetylglucosamine 1-carboxyvinyltransferase [Actinocatenispora thailandica]|uniref:UDP-N-acetylglucosamine 1-carboxyvinyltransferase n=1 Tax=Actinocatenispora thailandica TaxID=227318 RepID=A0A7R7DQT1_9ACTN|nr:UDP-N-acetylglucosamine 1-carboxyvinyltransferase [Actinocatenispora thailandica]
MDVIRVYGGTRLAGEVPVAGAKNSALKLMAAALLAPGRTTITNAPGITDISIMAEVLRRLGCAVEVDGGDITIDTPEELEPEADYNLVRRLRASICVLGPLLARCRHARVAHPGGDAIGSRGLDMHVAGLSRMGAEIGSEHGFVVARAEQLTGAQIWLDFPSVGATENILMAAVLARGTTVIDNAAREPEIVDLATMLNSMGAQVSGAGTATLEVTGVDAMHPTTHRTVGDRIVAGTWAFGAVMTRGDVTVRGVRAANLSVALDKLTDAGAAIEQLPEADGVPAFRVAIDRRPTAVDVVTLPFPGFATDLLPMAIGLGAVSGGVSLITENIFDGRFMFVNEMSRLGADIRTDGHHAVVRGRERLSGAPVRASDIRAGAGLAIAGLCAEGTTEVSHVHHIDRGYPHFVEQLRSLGAKAERCTAPDDDFGY